MEDSAVINREIDEQEAVPSELDRELHFLILHYLAGGPCRDAVQQLQQAATSHGLLPTRTDILGREHAMTYEQMSRQFSQVPQGRLRSVFQELLGAKRQSHPSLQGLDTLLGAGAAKLGVAPSGRERATAEPTLVEAVRVREGATLLRPPRRSPPGSHLLAKSLRHLKTVRGHHSPVYCVAIDRTGQLLITGADDRLVKIWNLQTGMLLMACRGHETEVTDLAVSCDNSMAASSSNDHSIRVWSLKVGEVGYPVSVLLGHTAPVSFITFHPLLPSVLLSSSFDGTCRVWDAAAGGGPMHILRAGPHQGLAPMPQPHGPPDPLPSEEARVASAQTAAAALSGDGNGERPLPDAEQEAGPSDAQQEVHVMVCAFSPDGSYIVAGANDCHCHVWSWDAVRRLPPPHASGAPVLDDDTRAASVEAVRKLPAPVLVTRAPGHSKDIFLLQFSSDGSGFATGSRDETLRVWRQIGRSGTLARELWQTSLVLQGPKSTEPKPKSKRRRKPSEDVYISQIAWSTDDSKVCAAVPGFNVMVWDSQTGEVICCLSGHECNVHVLEAHPKLPDLIMSASYDGTARIWDIRSGKELAMFSTKQTRPGERHWPDALELMDGHWAPDGTSLTVTDACGQLHIYGTADLSLYARARYDQFMLLEQAPLTRDLNGFVIDTDHQMPPHLLFSRDQMCDYLNEAYPAFYQQAWQSGRLWRMSVAAAQTHADGSSGPASAPAMQLYPPVISAGIWHAVEAGLSDSVIREEMDAAVQRLEKADAEYDRAQAEAAAAATAGVSALLRATGAVDAAVREPAPPAAGRGVGVSTRRSRRDDRGLTGGDQGASDNDSSSIAGFYDDGFAEVYGAETTTRAERLLMRSQRREQQMGGATRSRRRPPRPPPSERGRKRQRTRFADDDDDYLSGSMDTDEDDVDDEMLDMEEGTSQRTRRASGTRRSKRQRKESTTQGGLGGDSRNEEPAPRRRRSRRAGRSARSYAWLQDCRHRPGVYVPQLGDEVVYVRRGHHENRSRLSALGDDLPEAPWETVTWSGEVDGGEVTMRPAEPCEVVGLEYVVSQDEFANTLARVRLRLTSASTPLCGREFEVDIPPSHMGETEFVVLLDRYRASLDFRLHQRCKVFYPDDEGGGEWWQGEIVADELNAIEAEKYESDGKLHDQVLQLPSWERFTVAWTDQGSSSQDEPCKFCPWEIFDASEDEAGVSPAGGGGLDPAVAARVTAAVDDCLLGQRYNLFVAVPEPDESFPTSRGGGRMYYNEMVPLPMALLIIQARLQTCYYRSVHAVRHDARLLAANAAAFNGAGSSIARLADILASRLVAAVDADDQAAGEAKEAEDRFVAAEEAEAAEEAKAAAAAAAAEADPQTSERRPRRASARSQIADFSSEEEEELLPGPSLGPRPYHTRQSRAGRVQDPQREQRALRSRKRNYAEMEGSPEISDSEEEAGLGLRGRRGTFGGAGMVGGAEGRPRRERQQVQRYSPGLEDVGRRSIPDGGTASRELRHGNASWAPADSPEPRGVEPGEADNSIKVRLARNRNQPARFAEEHFDRSVPLSEAHDSEDDRPPSEDPPRQRRSLRQRLNHSPQPFFRDGEAARGVGDDAQRPSRETPRRSTRSVRARGERQPGFFDAPLQEQEAADPSRDADSSAPDENGIKVVLRARQRTEARPSLANARATNEGLQGTHTNGGSRRSPSPIQGGRSLRSRRGLGAGGGTVEESGRGTRASLRTRHQPSYREMEDADFLED